MRKVNRAPYKKHPVEEQEKVLAGPAENKDVKDDKPEQIVHPIQSKPEVCEIINYLIHYTVLL